MQYGVNGRVINGTQEEYIRKDGLKIKSEPIRLIAIFITVFLLSRVIVFVGEGDSVGFSPFGVAFLIAMVATREEDKVISASFGAFLGYCTIGYVLKDGLSYIVTILMLLGYSLIMNKLDKRIKVNYQFFIIFLSQFLYSFISSKYDFGINITISMLNSAVMIPVYYVINYGLKCLDEYNTNYFFNVEELISIAIILCLMVAGIGNISILGIGIRDIIAISVIVLISYVGGATSGAAIGISMGIIIGISSGDMLLGVGFYGVIGLVSGLFKETGKVFSFLSAILMYLILALYSKNLNVNGILEVVIGGGIFLLLPRKLVNILEGEISNESKGEGLNELHLKQVKEEFSERVENLGEALELVSTSLENMTENSNLLYKNKSTALVENLADRVCNGCSDCNKCWNREFNQTYVALQTLIQSREEKHPRFPKELEKKCLRKSELIKNAENIISISKADDITKSKLEQGRKLIANHVNNVAVNLDSMVKDFKRDVTWCGELERIIRRDLNKNSIRYNDIFCYTDNNGKMKIKINMENCSGGRYCIKSVIPIINEIMGVPMTVGEDGCRINPNNKDCTVVLQELPKYKVISYASMNVKEGEQFTGDTYTFGNIDNGKYMTLLSDGMGSGPEASKESRMTVDLVEKFMEAGFEVDTALNTVNSIMNMKFEEDEKFSTLDMNMIDLYTGRATFFKVGATSSFIKRGKKIIKVSSNMPPFGLVDKVEVEGIKEKLKDGDLIITLSDGVLDVDKDAVGNSEWLEEYLANKGGNASGLVNDILEESKKINNGRIKDDMTIIVSKVYAVY